VLNSNMNFNVIN